MVFLLKEIFVFYRLFESDFGDTVSTWICMERNIIVDYAGTLLNSYLLGFNKYIIQLLLYTALSVYQILALN